MNKKKDSSFFFTAHNSTLRGILNKAFVVAAKLLPEDIVWTSRIVELITAELGSMLHRSENEIKEIIMQGHGVGYIADNVLAGFSCFTVWTEHLVEVGGLVVAPEFRGQGIARSLVKEVTCLAKELYPHATIFCLAHTDGSEQAFFAANYERADLNTITSRYDILETCKTCPCPCWANNRFQGCELSLLLHVDG